MSLILAAFGLTGFARMGALQKKHAAAAPPGGATPTYYIYGF